MDDLISRSAAIEALTDAMCMTGYQSRAIEAVRFLPTIEAEPVRHGRWIKEEYYKGWSCSECGALVKHNCFDYCNCGAKMDGGWED